ncbi:nicotinamide mononucleotide transporter [Streptococcus downei F0415]|nr:nicotinamide mononucleotide transporter [Streptococcus downei F0415]
MLRYFRGGLIKDLFAERSKKQWFYLLALCFPTLVLEFMGGTRVGLGFLSALTGILCVILVAEGRISNYFIGFIHELTYLALSFQNLYYGEGLTTIFFTVMQFVGAYYWLVDRRYGKEKKSDVKDIKAKRLTWLGWIKSLAVNLVVWLLLGFI